MLPLLVGLGRQHVKKQIVDIRIWRRYACDKVCLWRSALSGHVCAASCIGLS